MRRGFILMEVLIALAISSMLTGLLFTIITQVTKSTRVVDDIMGVHMRMIVAIRQLERDISGVMVPPQAKKSEPKPESKPEPKSEKKENKSQDSSESKQQPKKVTKIFFSSTKDNNLELLTFITNNPLQRAWIGSHGVPSPCMVRVIYRLIPDKAVRKGSPMRYILTRQETQELDFDRIAKSGNENSAHYRAYEMLDDILQFKISYKPRESEKKKENKAVEKNKDILIWDSDSKLDDGTERPADKLIPGTVRCELVFADSERGKHTLILDIAIIPGMMIDQVATSTVQNQGAKKT